MTQRTIFALPLVFLLCFLVGCSQTSGPLIETGPDAEVTHDGLHRVRRSRNFQRAWVKPDFTLAGYTKILPVDAGIHYRRPPRRSRGEFALSEEQVERLRAGLADAVEAELTHDGRWEIVQESGPDTLVLRGAIIDLVVTVPPDRAGRDRTYVSSAGEATLVVELFDSESLEILARIADRRAVTRNDSTWWRSDSINNRAAARSVFRSWARRLREALEFARTLEGPQVESGGDGTSDGNDEAEAP